jgi:Carbohydrate binding domain
MSQRSGPRHLAGTRTSALIARNRPVAVTVAILLLLVLAVAAGRAVSALASRSSSMASPTTLATVPSPPETDAPDSGAPATTVPGNLVGNPGFESGLSGWRPLGGARIDRTDIAHQGSFAIKLSGGSTPDPGIAYPTVTSTKAKGALYQATVWVQASAPGVTGEIHLLEYVEGQRFAIFRSGLDLRDTRWHRLRVAQLVHVKGSTLALEVVAPRLPARADLLIDDVTVRQAE